MRPLLRMMQRLTPIFPLALLMLTGNCLWAGETVYLDQGWTDDERQTFYYLPQGSELLPYDWFMALEQPYQKGMFHDDEFLANFRYIPNPKSKTNPDGLPVGFAKGIDKQTGKAWMGLTCAACHTGSIEYKGKKIRVDGGTTLADAVTFQLVLMDALRNTVLQDGKFERFSAAILGADASEEQKEKLQTEFIAHYQQLARWSATSHPAHTTGFGNWDALSILKNAITATATSMPQNNRVPHIPVSYPSIWNTSKMDRVLWNGAVHNMTLRRIGEVIIVYGRAKVTATDKGYKFESSADLEVLEKMYKYTDKLKPPKWPEEVLGAIDQEKARRGQRIYEREGCAKCHPLKPYPLTKPNKWGKQFIDMTRTPIEEVGTDPNYAQYFVTRSAQTGNLQPMLKGTPYEGKQEMPGALMFLALLKGITLSEVEALNPKDDEERARLLGYREIPETPKTMQEVEELVKSLLVYKTGPLEGIWATAPYLHNASVPSLYQLLLPPEERMKKFYLGSPEFNPVHVGYRTDTSGVKRAWEAYEFDTSKMSMSNQGHDYGTKINETERMELIEFLKTL